MCGIFGHTFTGRDKEESRQALNRLAHRGPDQWNDWQDEQVYLGHRRLSIMDLSAKGRQPMSDQDENILITANGEIYNFASLRAELESKHSFRSHSDSEVLIHGYREWGIDTLVHRLEGMYAFTLYDREAGKLYIVRDRVGVKPLYYSRVGTGLAWASELKALAEFHKAEGLEVDYTAVYDYLTYLYIPAPKTLYKQVYKLEPAHYLTVDVKTGQVEDKAYWQLDKIATNQQADVQEAAATVRELVRKAVKEQLMSDVPVGFFLSGGMDSSTVVAAAAEISNKLHTYSIGFDVKEHDETHYAELVAKHFNTTHTRREVGVDEVKKLFPNIRDWYDEPFADTSAFPTHLVSKLAKPTSTVVLTGDGGDEVFGGYNWYTAFVEQFGTRRALTHKLSGKATDKELAHYATLMGGLSDEAKATYRRRFDIPADYDDYWHFRAYYRPELPVLTRLQYLDFHTYLPGDILTKVDRASMAVSLECRVPLLSTELIEYVFSLPESIRYHKGELKGLMKEAFRDLLPTEITERAKKGFSIPTGSWKSQLMEKKMPMSEFILQKLYTEILE